MKEAEQVKSLKRNDSLLERIISPVRRLVHWLSARPTLWNIFRRILEFNFREEKRVINEELVPHAEMIRRTEDANRASWILAAARVS